MPDSNQKSIYSVDIDLHAAIKRWRFFRAINKLIRQPIYTAYRAIWKFLFASKSANQQITKAKPRVLLIRPDHIGDFVYSLPSILALKSAFSDDYSFEILINPCNASVAKRLGIFDAIYLFKMFGDKREKLLPSFAEYDQIAKIIGDIDILIDIRSDRFTRNLNDWIEANSSSLSVFYRTNQVLKKYDSIFLFIQKVANDLGLSIENAFPINTQIAQQLLIQQFPAVKFTRPTIGFCPEARHQKKLWPQDEIGALIKQLAQAYGDSYTLVLIGSNSQQYLYQHVCINDMRGKTSLDEAFELVNVCQFFIGFDSGLTHLASLLGKPTIAIFNGYTDANEWAPIPVDDNLVVLQSTQSEQTNMTQAMTTLTTMMHQDETRGGGHVS